MNHLTQLIISQKTSFTTAEIETLLAPLAKRSVERFLRRAKKDGRLLNPSKGVWTLPVFDTNELACTLYPQSYISLETVLYESGVIFQRYGSSTRLIRSDTRDILFQDHHYITRKLKYPLLTNPIGIRTHSRYRIATPERALCDMLYLRPDAQLDNPQYFHTPQSKARLTELLPLYPQTTQSHVHALLLIKI